MPAVYSYSTNRPTTNDNEFSLLAKLALTYGLSPTTADNEFSLLAKLALAIGTGVTPTPEPEPPTLNLVGSGTGIGADMDDFSRAMAAGYTGSGDAANYQREAAVDVYRIHYHGGSAPAALRLEETPTIWQGVAGGTPSVTPGELKFSASWTNPAVMASVASLQYQVDSDTPVGFATGTTLTDITATAGDHTLKIQTVSTSGLFGAWATSAEFEVEADPDAPLATDNFDAYLDADELDEHPTWVVGRGTVLVSNATSTQGSVFGGGTFPWAVHTATPNADHRSEATLTGTMSGGAFAGLVVRAQSGAATCYAFLFDGSDYYVIDYIAGAQTIITSGSVALVSGDGVAIEAAGTGSSTRLKIQKRISGVWSDIASGINPGTSHYIDGGGFGVGGQDNGSALRITEWNGFNL